VKGTLVTPKVLATVWASLSSTTGRGQSSPLSQDEGGHPSRADVAQILAV
jgi:hypothetical protein